jgi:hypothetical protein
MLTCIILVSEVSGVWACDSNGQFACELVDCANSSLQFAILTGDLMPGQAVSSALGLSSSDTAIATATATVTSTMTPTTRSSSAASQTPILPALNSTSCPNSEGTIAAVGAGVGTPLLLGMLAALAFLVRERRRSKAALSASTKTWAPFTTGIKTQGTIHSKGNAQELSTSNPICEMESQTTARPTNH